MSSQKCGFSPKSICEASVSYRLVLEGCLNQSLRMLPLDSLAERGEPLCVRHRRFAVMVSGPVVWLHASAYWGVWKACSVRSG